MLSLEACTQNLRLSLTFLEGTDLHTRMGLS
jgi:hypothetical protein